jgi:hypothetical protein
MALCDLLQHFKLLYEWWIKSRNLTTEQLKTEGGELDQGQQEQKIKYRI